MTASAKKSKASKTAAAVETTTQSTVVVPTGRDVLVPYSQLFISKHNTRTKRNKQGLHQLAALIEHFGLLQRLMVVMEDGRMGIIAGGRRYEAMGLNVEAGKMSVDALIECKEFESVDAAKLSLAENSGREDMHRADEIATFRKMIDEDGMSVAEVAAAWGVTPLTVERRLKLARLAPRFIEMYRNNEIDTDVLMVLAVAEDHATQEAAWESLPKGHRSAYYLREVLTKGEVGAKSRLAVFVGVKNYEKAGGSVRRDLFADNNDGIYLQDTGLLHELATAKLQKSADKLTEEGWSWVDCSLDSDRSDYRNFGRESIGQRKPTAAEARALNKLKATEASTETALQEHYKSDESADDYEEKADALETAARDAEEAVEKFEQGLEEWMPEQKARAGAMVSLDYKGKIEVTYGLIRPSDKKAAIKAMIDAGEAVPHGLDRGIRADFSERLMRDMTAHRTAALQAALAQNPKVALVALVHTMALAVFSSRRSFESTLKISVQVTDTSQLVELAPSHTGSKAAEILEPAHQMWADQLPSDPGALFGWLLDQPQPVLLDLLAFCAARSINAIHGRPYGRDESDVIAEALSLDMADWWAPTPATYFSGVSKTKAIEAITEATGFDATKELTTLKKADWMNYCTAKLHGTRWLPAPLRAKASAVAATDAVDDETSEESDAEA